jgi:hypothetical protein
MEIFTGEIDITSDLDELKSELRVDIALRELHKEAL